MAIANTTNWEFNASATGSMVNGGGFNYLNAAFLTNGSWTSANTSAPVLSSASYNFVAGDVGAWIYSSNTTNPGFYKILSVATNAATVDGTIGNAVILNTITNRWTPSTIVGVDSSATPSSKTFGVDYSQSTAAKIAGVADFNAVGASVTLTSITAGFTPVMVGNIFHQTTTGTGAFGVVGWYEIATYVNATTVTLDRTPNSGTASVNTTGSVGGALDLAGTLPDSFFEQINAGNFVFIKNGAYTLGSAISIASTNSTSTTPSYITGYNAVRGDFTPTNYGSNRPTINLGTLQNSFGQYQNIAFISCTGSGTTMFTTGTGAELKFSKLLHTRTAGGTALSCGTSGNIWGNEAISLFGTGISTGTSKCYGNYAHDSLIGITSASTTYTILGNLIASCDTTGLSLSSGTVMGNVQGNTIYGAEIARGTGILLGASLISCNIRNNIIYGWVTGVSQTTTQLFSNQGSFNDYFNNTSNTSNFSLDPTDLTINPTFTSVGQLANVGTVSTSGSVLTDTGANFNGNITDNVDFIHVDVNTGGSIGIFPIISHTNTTITVSINTLGTGTGTTYRIPNLHNYSVGTNLKATGFPGSFGAAVTTGYMDIGAVQRQEAGGGGATFTGFMV